jgi:hypothetical protein
VRDGRERFLAVGQLRQPAQVFRDPGHGSGRQRIGLQRESADISMDGRGRALENIIVGRLWRTVKHEDVYLEGYANIQKTCLDRWTHLTFARVADVAAKLGICDPDSYGIPGLQYIASTLAAYTAWIKW